MYLLAKIHKEPLKTWAIISYSGSICYGLAVWVDKEIKKVIRLLPYVATSSAGVVKKLRSRNWNSKLFTMDATAMYTNIHLGHAIPVIEKFLLKSPLGQEICKKEQINVAAIIYALEVVTKNNIFMFGDTIWRQIAGTAMGTPPVPDYATLYFAIHEIQVIPRYPESEDSYGRYIDDRMGIWNTSLTANDDERWQQFQEEIGSFGADHSFFASNPCYTPLQWTFEPRATSAIFLDLNITLNKEGCIATTMYEKKLNLYLYIPSHSCHSPGIVKGLIFGAVHRAKSLCTNPAHRMPFIRKTYHCLLARGHQAANIKPIFQQAINSILIESRKIFGQTTF